MKALKEKANLQLITSDQINNGDLLRFYTDSGLKTIDPSEYSYLHQNDRLLETEKSLGADSTSVYSKHNNQTTVDLFKTQTYKELNPTAEPTTTSSSEETGAAE